MGRAEQAGSVLPEVARLAAEHAPALTRAFHILDDGALVGPAADKLFREMSQQHQTVRNGFLHAFEQVRALATQAKHGPPRVSAPHLAGAPSNALRTGLGLLAGGLRASGNTVGGDPNKLHQLGLELARAGRSWENAGQRLGSILGGLGLDGGAGKTISRAGGWVAGQQREVNHRRNELLQSDALNAGLGMLTGGLNASLTDEEKRRERELSSTSLNLHDLRLVDMPRKAFNLWLKSGIPGVWDATKEFGDSLWQMAKYHNPYTAWTMVINGDDKSRKEWWDHSIHRGLWELGKAGVALSPVPGTLWYLKDPEGWKKQANGFFASILGDGNRDGDGDDWSTWKRDPVRAFSHAGTNIVSFFLGPGEVIKAAGAGMKLAGAASKAGQASKIGRAGEVFEKVPRQPTLRIPDKGLPNLHEPPTPARIADDLGSHVGDKTPTPPPKPYLPGGHAEDLGIGRQPHVHTPPAPSKGLADTVDKVPSNSGKIHQPDVHTPDAPSKGITDILKDAKRPHNWTAIDEAAIQHYTISGYKRLNAYLRGDGFFSPEEAAALQKQADQLDTALAKLDGEAGTSYRGLQLDEVGLARYEKGAVITEDAPISTSKDPSHEFVSSPLRNTVMVIEGKSGRTIEHIAARDDTETLFRKGTKFEVTSKVWDADMHKWVIHLKEVR